MNDEKHRTQIKSQTNNQAVQRINNITNQIKTVAIATDVTYMLSLKEELEDIIADIKMGRNTRNSTLILEEAINLLTNIDLILNNIEDKSVLPLESEANNGIKSPNLFANFSLSYFTESPLPPNKFVIEIEPPPNETDCESVIVNQSDSKLTDTNMKSNPNSIYLMKKDVLKDITNHHHETKLPKKTRKQIDIPRISENITYTTTSTNTDPISLDWSLPEFDVDSVISVSSSIPESVKITLENLLKDDLNRPMNCEPIMYCLTNTHIENLSKILRMDVDKLNMCITKCIIINGADESSSTSSSIIECSQSPVKRYFPSQRHESNYNV